MRERKPKTDTLIANGALWNMFIVASRAQTLLNFLDKASNFVSVMRGAMQGSDAGAVGAMTRLYAELPFEDFYRDVLAHYPALLKVQSVSTCGWTDLGTPNRVLATFRIRYRARAAMDIMPRMLYI